MNNSENIDDVFRNSEEHKFTLENEISEFSRLIILKAADDLMEYFNSKGPIQYSYKFGLERVFNIQLNNGIFPVASISTTLLLGGIGSSAIDVSNPLNGKISPRYWSPSFSINLKTKRTNTIWTDITRVRQCDEPRVIFSYFVRDRNWLLDYFSGLNSSKLYLRSVVPLKALDEMNEEEQNEFLDSMLPHVISKNKLK